MRSRDALKKATLKKVSLGILLVALVAGHVAATQYFAAKLGYQELLGNGLFELGRGRVYEPFAFWVWFFRFYEDAPEVFARGFSLIGLGFGAGVVLVAWLKKQLNPRPLDSCGTAHWADEATIREAKLLDGKGIFLGKLEDGRYLRDNDNRHAMVISPTRGGKGVGLVTPTALSWQESILFVDIKGEIYGLTAGYRKEVLQQTVIKFDPASAEGSAYFNPLDEIRLGTKDEIKDCINIVQALSRPDGNDKPDHWRDLAASLIEGVVMHLKYLQQGDASFVDVLNYIFGEISIRDRLWEMTKCQHGTTPELQNFLEETYRVTDGVHPFVKKKAYAALQKDEREFAGIVSTAEELLKDFYDPILARNTSMSSFHIHDLMNKETPVSLYLVVPPSDLARMAKFFRLIVVLIYQRLTEKMEFQNGRMAPTYRHKLLLLLDEFPALGRIMELEKALGYIAGYGLRAFIIIQGLNQLFAPHMYGRNTSIIDNCHIRVFHTPNDAETPDYVSKMMGKKTITVRNKSYQNDLWQLLGENSYNVQEKGRDLMTAAEISELDAEDEIIFVAGRPPIRCKKIRYYQDKNFERRLREAPKTDSLYPLEERERRKEEICAAIRQNDAEKVARAREMKEMQEKLFRLNEEEAMRKGLARLEKHEKEQAEKQKTMMQQEVSAALLAKTMTDAVPSEVAGAVSEAEAAEASEDGAPAGASAGDGASVTGSAEGTTGSLPDETGQPDGFDDRTSGQYVEGREAYDFDF